MAEGRYSLAGRTVLVTGAARGIGAEAARRMARRGARLALVGLEADQLASVAASCGRDAIWLEADVTDRAALEDAVETTVRTLGGIDVVIANAGIGAGGMLVRSDPQAIERVLEINLIGAVRTLRLCLPHVIERRGYMVPVLSIAALVQAPGLAAYAASKAGLEAFTNSLRIEVGHLGVGVGTAYFSWIETEMAKAIEDRRDFAVMRSSRGGPLAKTYPVSVAADALVDGVERRARFVAAPGWIRAMLVLRGVLQPLVERRVRDKMPELDRLSAEEAERLGERADAPMGPGGEAALRSPAASR
ncbi:MAG TPA: short-chain dehydrogenase/reductase [Thermoleophilaceae bacterium]|nr:short-chain dehydrogenase/reductase [Thermoleophilaceae bacterium]